MLRLLGDSELAGEKSQYRRKTVSDVCSNCSHDSHIKGKTCTTKRFIIYQLLPKLTLNQIFTILSEMLQRHQVAELRNSVEAQRLRLDRLLADHLGRHLFLIQHQGDVHRPLVRVPDGRVEDPLSCSHEGVLGCWLDGEVVPTEIRARFQASERGLHRCTLLDLEFENYRCEKLMMDGDGGR